MSEHEVHDRQKPFINNGCPSMWLMSTRTCLLSVMVLLLSVFFFLQRMLRRLGMPPGPMAYPFVGTILDFCIKRITVLELMRNYRDRFGNIFTLWFCGQPAVVIYDVDLIKEATALNNTDFMGRPSLPPYLTNLVGNGTDFVMLDYSPCWESLRRVSQTAIKKVLEVDSFYQEICVLVDDMIEKEMKAGRLFEPKEAIYLVISNAMTQAAYGQRYEKNDREFTLLKDFNDSFLVTYLGGVVTNFAPILAPFFRKRNQLTESLLKSFLHLLKDNMRTHVKTLHPDCVRDLTDSLLQSQNKAKEKNLLISSQYLTTDNLAWVLGDLYLGGTETTVTTINWIIRILAGMPDVQEKIYKEICDNIGDRIPTPSDKNLCPYLCAVLAENFRFRALSPFGVPRKTLKDTKLGGYRIPKDTYILFFTLGLNMDPKIWEDPETFRPERFLDPCSQFVSPSSHLLSPFGHGRRVCVGEKMAMRIMFLVIARLVQRCKVRLEPGIEALDFEPLKLSLFRQPKPFKVLLEERSV